MNNKCKQCGYEWVSKDPDKKPVSCPKCKRYDWEDINNLFDKMKEGNIELEEVNDYIVGEQLEDLKKEETKNENRI